MNTFALGYNPTLQLCHSAAVEERETGRPPGECEERIDLPAPLNRLLDDLNRSDVFGWEYRQERCCNRETGLGPGQWQDSIGAGERCASTFIYIA